MDCNCRERGLIGTILGDIFKLAVVVAVALLVIYYTGNWEKFLEYAHEFKIRILHVIDTVKLFFSGKAVI